MDMKSTGSNISRLPFAKSAAPASPYLDFLRELSTLQHKPVRLVIDFGRFAELVTSGPVVDYLSTEIQLWAKTLGIRQIASLYVVHPYRYLAPFELTRILHVIASRFQVTNLDRKNFAVISGIEEINSEHLALVKGLGCNRYQIVVSTEQLHDISSLCKKINLLRDYLLEPVGIQLLHPDCLDEIRETIRRINQECQPDYICISNAWDTNEFFASSEAEQKSCDEEINNDHNIDILELGPEGNSKISDLKIQNYCSADKYKVSLEVNRLPIHIHHAT